MSRSERLYSTIGLVLILFLMIAISFRVKSIIRLEAIRTEQSEYQNAEQHGCDIKLNGVWYSDITFFWTREQEDGPISLRVWQGSNLIFQGDMLYKDFLSAITIY